MKNVNLKNLDQDLQRGIDYNKKHGGSPLKKIMKRPEVFPTSHFGGSVWGNPQPTNKCKCGNIKFKEQQVCYKCYGKLQRKKIRQTIQ